MNIKKLLTPENMNCSDSYFNPPIDRCRHIENIVSVVRLKDKPLTLKHLKTLAVGTELIYKHTLDIIAIKEHGSKHFKTELGGVELKLSYQGNAFFLKPKNK